MGLVAKTIGNGKSDESKETKTSPVGGSIADGAIDTLDCLIRTMGDISFPLDTDVDQDASDGRRVRLAELGQIDEFPVVQGHHHYYLPRAA